jgi:acyl-CoA reductase-like NAD-dependent aldehyde dehydrogenase
MKKETLLNFIDVEWIASTSQDHFALYNPAKDEVIGYVPLSGTDDVH